MASLFVCDPYQKCNSEKIELQGSSKIGIQATLVFLICLMSYGGPLSQRRQEVRLILFYKIINGLAQVPFECVLVDAYKGTKRKHNNIMQFRQIGHTTSQYGQLFFLPKTISAWNRLAFAEAPSLAVF